MADAVARLLATHGLRDARREPFAHDGWSGSEISLFVAEAGRAVVKRTGWRRDWIVRATDDRRLRESWVAGGPLAPPRGVSMPYRGVARDGDDALLLMPDLSGRLIAWTEGAPPVEAGALDRVLAAVAALHATAWWPGAAGPTEPSAGLPWCDLARRLLLLVRPSAERLRADGVAAGDRFISGWDAFDRHAPPEARDLVDGLAAEPAPLVAALGRLPAAGLHGDLKLANVALLADGAIGLIDWQMTLRAPVAVELGWLLVSNVALLPEPPDLVLARYGRHAAADVVGDPDAQADLAAVVGLLLRGWRKGLDLEAGTPTGWGASPAEDLAWWCRRAVEAADRRL